MTTLMTKLATMTKIVISVATWMVNPGYAQGFAIHVVRAAGNRAATRPKPQLTYADTPAQTPTDDPRTRQP
jgi:hypothetical protein